MQLTSTSTSPAHPWSRLSKLSDCLSNIQLDKNVIQLIRRMKTEVSFHRIKIKKIKILCTIAANSISSPSLCPKLNYIVLDCLWYAKLSSSVHAQNHVIIISSIEPMYNFVQGFADPLLHRHPHPHIHNLWIIITMQYHPYWFVCPCSTPTPPSISFRQTKLHFKKKK